MNWLVADEGPQVFDAAVGIVDDERLIAWAEEAGAVAAMADGDEVGQRAVGVADFLGGDGAEAGIDQAAHAFAVAGVQVVVGAGVGAFRGAHAADDGGMVHEPGQPREVLADADAGDVGVDGLERAAVGGAGPQVEGVLVAGAAVHPQEDAAFVPSRLSAGDRILLGLGGPAASTGIQPDNAVRAGTA